MTDDLSLRAKNLLAAQHLKLMLDVTAQTKASHALTEILSWCEESEFRPGKWIRAKQTYRFEQSQIDKIEHILLQQGFASIYDKFDQDTHQSASHRNPNEKQGKIKPTQHLVLAAVTQKTALDAMQQHLYTCQQVNIELDVTRLNLDSFESLVVVENRDSFNDWFEYQPYTNLSKPLVIYRGDKHHSTACKTLLKSCLSAQSNKPAIYFGDFDLAALRIAVSAGYTQLLLPAYARLAAQAIKQHYPSNQEKYLTKLQRDCPTGWQPLLHLMGNKRAGLRQQKMYQTPLILHEF
jgi:hypothetical protein